MPRRPEWMQPRDGKTFRVLISTRISGCQNQKTQSNEDQEQHCKEEVPSYYQEKNIEYKVIKSVAKGELLEREEVNDLVAELRSRKWDLLLVEDLGRLLRDVTAKEIFGIARDYGTRAVAVNDCVDNWVDTWEEDALAACSDHVAHNRNGSRRIKQKTMNRFKTRGELFQQPIAGYRRKNDEERCDFEKLTEWTETINIGAKKILALVTDTEVGEWFDEVGFKPGPFSDAETWSGAAVKRFFTNSLLKGKPYRGARTSEKLYEAGKRRPVKNPDGPTFIDRPDLAHLDEATFELLRAHYATKAERYRRAQAGETDTLTGVPRSRSRYPGPAAKCFYCGHEAVWGANGQKYDLQCNGSRQHKCWCSFGIDGRRITREALKMVVDHLKYLSGFQAQFAQMLIVAKQNRPKGDEESSDSLRRKLAEVGDQQKKIAVGIAESGGAAALYTKLYELEADEKLLLAKLQQTANAEQQPLELPETLEEMLEEIRQRLSEDIDSYELGTELRAMTKSLYVYAVRLLDGERPYMRARLTLDVSALWKGFKDVPDAGAMFVITRDIALFKVPQRAQIREQVVQMRATGITERAVAKALGVTVAAAQRQMKLHRLMTEAGLTTPYVLVTSPDELSPKCRRHHHRKYKFLPVDGYVPPEL